MYDSGDRFDEDAGIFDDAMDVGEEVDVLSRGCTAPIASLLREQIVYEGDKRSLEKPADPYGTPLKRKPQSFRGRCAAGPPEKSSDINDENGEDGSDRVGSLDGPPMFKRRKSFAESRFTSLRAPLKIINRCHSEGEALLTLPKDENCQLIGDHSANHALPIMERPCIHDLKCISSDTVRRLLNGEFSESVEDFTFIDCRYPYEYEGGHIKGAINSYTQELLTEHVLNESVLTKVAANASGDASATKRRVLIFYCEYSQERGPRMTRFLRKRDRQLNEHQYPKLFYPEIYLLDGGYKNFFMTCSDLCQPRTYRSMLDEHHATELRKFRSKSKSWCSGAAGEITSSVTRRPGLNRGLFRSKND